MTADNDDPRSRAAQMRDMVADGFVAAQERVRKVKRDAVDDAITTWFDRHEAELSPHVVDYLQAHIDDPDTPAKVRDTLRAIVAPEHATSLSLVLLGVGAVILPMVAAAVAPDAQFVGNKSWAAQQVMPLSAGDAALNRVKYAQPDVDYIAEGAQTGYDATRMDALYRNLLQPPSLGQLQDALRRGFIDAGVFNNGLRQNVIDTAWSSVLSQLAFDAPNKATAVAAAVQNQLDLGTAQAKFVEGGGNPVDFAWEYATAGRPPGIEQLLELRNRGLIDDGVVLQAVAESDIKNKYGADILAMRVYLPPVRSIVPMLRSGAIDDARALQLLTQRGVTAQDAQTYIAEAHAGRTATQKQLSVAQVVDLYETGHIDSAQATARIVALGYDATEAGEILFLADERVVIAARNLAVSRIRSLFVSHRMSPAQALTDLGALGVAASRSTQLLAIWTAERNANVPTLTVAQLQGAYRRGTIDLATFTVRVAQYGYVTADVIILAAEAFPPTSAAKAKELTATQIAAIFKAGFVDRSTAIADLVAEGYTHADAAALVTLWAQQQLPAPKGLSVAQVGAMFKAGTVDRTTAIADLVTDGYTSTDANALVNLWVAEAAPGSQQLSATLIGQLYKGGVITAAQTLAELTAVGYSQLDAQNLVTLWT